MDPLINFRHFGYTNVCQHPYLPAAPGGVGAPAACRRCATRRRLGQPWLRWALLDLSLDAVMSGQSLEGSGLPESRSYRKIWSRFLLDRCFRIHSWGSTVGFCPMSFLLQARPWVGFWRSDRPDKPQEVEG